MLNAYAKTIKSHIRSWVILFVVAFVAMLVNFNFTALNLAIIDISKDITSSLRSIQWTLSLYVLMIGVLVIPASHLSTRYGHRRIFFIASFIFCLSSIFIGLSENIFCLLLGRGIQGVGAALFIPTLYYLAFTYVDKSKQTLAIAIITGAVSVGLAMGPTIGPFIQSASNWRWIFFSNIPVLLIASILIFLTATQEEKTQNIQIYYTATIGMALLMCLAIFSLSLFSFSVFFYLYALVKIQQKRPLIPLDLFTSKEFSIYSSVLFTLQFVFGAILFIGCIYMQSILGYKILDISIILAALTGPMGVFSPIGSYLATKLDKRIPLVIALFLSGLGCYLFAVTKDQSSTFQVVLALLPIGSGIGLGLSACNTLMSKSIESGKIRLAAGTFYALSSIANVMGITLTASIVSYFSKQSISSMIQNIGSKLSSIEITALKNAVEGPIYSILKTTPSSQTHIAALNKYIHTVFLDGMFISLMIASIICFLLGIFIYIFLSNSEK